MKTSALIHSIRNRLFILAMVNSNIMINEKLFTFSYNISTIRLK